MRFAQPHVRRLVLEKAIAGARAADSHYNFIEPRWVTETESYNKFLSEIHLKYALPFACLVFLFVGAPLGAIVRKGGLGMPVVVSIGFFILFYTLMTHGRKMAYNSQVEVWFGIWLPVIAIFPVAAYLTYQSSTDSRLFDLSSYKLAFDSLMQKLGLKK
jgi:lipopolysaccharide export system permease protein